MRVLMSGMNGTVAPALAARLAREDIDVVAWDRARMPIDSEAQVRAALGTVRPRWMCHIATGPPDWASWIAAACLDLDIRLLWAGSVSVFSDSAKAPISIDCIPDAADDYGRYKIECERRVRMACPGALIARLGWQIGDAPGSNTMTDHLARTAESNGGEVKASTRWIPSCAFLDDTADALWSLMQRGEAGIFHLEGNASGMSFFEIATGLARLADRGWAITPTGEPARDNRMEDGRLHMGQVAQRLALGGLRE